MKLPYIYCAFSPGPTLEKKYLSYHPRGPWELLFKDNKEHNLTYLEFVKMLRAEGWKVEKFRIEIVRKEAVKCQAV